MKELVTVHPLDDCLKAVGINSKGERIEFEIGTRFFHCTNEDLISLKIPDGVKKVWCNNNLLTELILPEGVIELYCWDNKLTELKIPSSIKKLSCDRHVLGLYKVDWECKITLF